MSNPSLLALPAPRAVSRAALGYLDAAAAALDRMQAYEDGEALHDFRVALRRLRSCARSHERLLGKSFPDKARRQLRDLQRVTGAGRDAEVHLQWIGSHRDGLSRREQVGYRWLVARLARERDAAYARAAAELSRGFESVVRRLRPRLETAAADTTAATGAADSFAAALAPLARDLSGKLERRLRAVHSLDNQTEAHRARIAAKRLRYLLEPAAAELTGAEQAVERLKTLQDLLGELHDMQTLSGVLGKSLEEAAAERGHTLERLTATGAEQSLRSATQHDERQGLVALARTTAERIAELFATLESAWLGDRPQHFFAELTALADGLASRGRAGVEIERKYLLRALPEAARRADSYLIEQGYIPGERLQERLRRSHGVDGERFLRTVKLGAGIERTEVEEETTPELFASLWPLTAGRRVRKRRYFLAEGELTWEIDEFLDRELVLAEVELPTADTPVPIPEWLAPYLEREVTGDPAYLNITLAR